MSSQAVAAVRSAVPRPGDRRSWLVVAGAAMILGQLAFRGWALYGSFFYLDDYTLLAESRESSLSLGYLVEPWNSHLMPGGRLVAWVVGQAGVLNWQLAATLTLLLQLAASVAALWMLVTLFGRRLAVLPLLGLYLTWSMTVPALMWWTAALNQLAMQGGFFLAVGAWVRYLRHGGLRWAALAYGGVAFGLLFDVKALLVLPVLVYLALAHFAAGSLVSRVRTVLTTYRGAALLGAPFVLGYVGYYVTHVSQPFERPGWKLSAELLDSMIGTAFTSSALGGPWRWAPLAPPNAFAEPPAWTVSLCWVAVAAVVLYAVLRRERTGRAWGLLVGYLLVLFVLLLTSRGPDYGALIGREYRYLTDAACVLVLTLGLVFLPLRGAVQGSRRRRTPLLTVRVPARVTGGLVALVCVSSLVSSAGAVHYWHDDNASKSYVATLESDLETYGAVDLADTGVPEEVYPAIFAPDNEVRQFVGLLDADATFPETTADLTVVADDGGLRRALIGPGLRTAPGPVADCGYQVGDAGALIPLGGTAFPWSWWVRIGYLASADSPVRVGIGSTLVETDFRAGLNSLFVRVEGSFDAVRLDGLDPGTTVCVDTVEVGQPEPGSPLE